VADLHAGGAVMWIGGDAIMFGLMMLVFLMWSMDERGATSGHGWLEGVRRANLATLVGAHERASAGPPAGQQAAGSGTGDWSARGSIDDDEHLAAYNAFLARLNRSDPGRGR
jgi:putative copper resistance protein D